MAAPAPGAAEIQNGDDLSRALARRLIERVGLRVAAEQIGIKPDALARYVAGAKSHAGTVKLVRDGLKRGGEVTAEKPLEFKFSCPFCGGEVVVFSSLENEGPNATLHAEPTCPTFDESDALSFVKKMNLEVARRRGVGLT